VFAGSLLYAYPAFALAGKKLREWQLDRALRVAPFALDQHRIALVDSSVAQRRVHAEQSCALFRNQQHAGSVAVEPMDEFQKFGLRARSAQLLDEPERNAAATVHGEA